MTPSSLTRIALSVALVTASHPLAVSGSPFAFQTVVESDGPRDPDLTLADEPLVRIGTIDGQAEYIFGKVMVTRALNADGVTPYGSPACTPDGDLVFTPWPESDLTVAEGGSAYDYELEHLDWNGRVTRIARWIGPDLTVTRERQDKFLDAYLARYDTPEDVPSVALYRLVEAGQS